MLVSYDETVKAEIRAQMARQKLSQTQLAGRLGWKQQAVSRCLSGGHDLKLTEIEQFASALGVSISDLGLPLHPHKAGARS